MIFYLFYEFLQIIFIVFLGVSTFFSRNKKLKRFFELRNPFLFINKINEIFDKFSELKKKNNDLKIYWIHVSSAGELEQAIPIAKYFLTQINAVFFLTYYSPSAEPFIKNFPSLIGSVGLPIDLSFVYNKIFKKIKFDALFFVRYDLWPRMILSANKYQISLVLLCATHKNTKNNYFSFINKAYKKYLYGKFSYIFTVSWQDVDIFKVETGVKNVCFSGDTKWWRAKERAHGLIQKIDGQKIQCLFHFFKIIMEKRNDVKCIIFGSPHSEEHELALLCVEKFKNKIITLYVPHEIEEQYCLLLKKQFEDKSTKTILCSELFLDMNQNGNLIDSEIDCIIVDVMGYLAELYSLGNVVIVGGGFDGQIHNVLEPAAHGKPVLIGSQINRAPEATRLSDEGALILFETPNLLFQFLFRWVSLGQRSSDSTSRDEDVLLTNVSARASKIFDELPNTSKVIFDVLYPKS